jgi:hypothetical protein
MGLSEIFYKILEHYETELHFHFEETFIKILYRCLLGFRSIERLETIFAMITKKDLYLRDFISATDSENPNEQAKSEELLTQFVL